jgi:hypothetical protein
MFWLFNPFNLFQGERKMANATLQEDIEQVKRVRGVLASTKLFIEGEAARLQAAIAQALANGATEAELAPLSAEVDAMEAQANEIAAAINTNPTPA